MFSSYVFIVIRTNVIEIVRRALLPSYVSQVATMSGLRLDPTVVIRATSFEDWVHRLQQIVLVRFKLVPGEQSCVLMAMLKLFHRKLPSQATVFTGGHSNLKTQGSIPALPLALFFHSVSNCHLFFCLGNCRCWLTYS